MNQQTSKTLALNIWLLWDILHRPLNCQHSLYQWPPRFGQGWLQVGWLTDLRKKIYQASNSTGAPLMMGPLKSLPGLMKPDQWFLQKCWEVQTKKALQNKRSFAITRRSEHCLPNCYMRLFARIHDTYDCNMNSWGLLSSPRGVEKEAHSKLSVALPATWTGRRTESPAMPVFSNNNQKTTTIIKKQQSKNNNQKETNDTKGQKNKTSNNISEKKYKKKRKKNILKLPTSLNSRRMDANSPAVKAMFPQNSWRHVSPQGLWSAMFQKFWGDFKVNLISWCFCSNSYQLMVSKAMNSNQHDFVRRNSCYDSSWQQTSHLSKTMTPFTQSLQWVTTRKNLQ